MYSRVTVLVAATEAPRKDSAPQIHLNAITVALEDSHFAVQVAIPDLHESFLYRVTIGQIRTLHKTASADITYMRWHPLSVLPIILPRTRTKLVLEINGTEEDLILAHPRARILSPALRALRRLQLRRADGIIAVTPGLAKWASQAGASKAHVAWAPNGAKAEIVRFASEGAQRQNNVLFLGELAAWQGIETLIQAYTDPAWPRDLRLTIIGGGKNADWVEKASRELGFSYLGHLPREEALGHLGRAELSVSPQSGRFLRNQHGVSPIKVSESLMVGTPVIASNLPGLTDIIQPGVNGETFICDDPESLARAVASAHAAEYDLRGITEHAQSHFSWEVIGKQVAAFISEWFESSVDPQTNQDN